MVQLEDRVLEDCRPPGVALLERLLASLCPDAPPLLVDALQLLHVLRMDGVDLLLRGALDLLHVDRPSHHGVHRHPQGHHADVQAEDTVQHAASQRSAKEERDGKAHPFLHGELEVLQPLVVVDPEDVVLAKGEHGHQGCTGGQGNLHEALSVLQHEVDLPRLRCQRLARPAHNQHDRGAGTPSKVPLDRLPTGVVDAHAKKVLTKERYSKVHLQCQETEVDPRKEPGKASGIRGKVAQRADADDPVGVIAKEVVPRRVQLRRARQRHGEVGGEVSPERAPPQRLEEAPPSLGRAVQK
mmetsp:Transcript_62469/g.166966  ORF Transcript_62469/g.166966 Transcript_62469/m.166966 type:complete len:298 (+) Transcript_62469:129-1022(+)